MMIIIKAKAVDIKNLLDFFEARLKCRPNMKKEGFRPVFFLESNDAFYNENMGPYYVYPLYDSSLWN